MCETELAVSWDKLCFQNSTTSASKLWACGDYIDKELPTPPKPSQECYTVVQIIGVNYVCEINKGIKATIGTQKLVNVAAACGRPLAPSSQWEKLTMVVARIAPDYDGGGDDDFEKELRSEGKLYSVEANTEEVKAFVKPNFEHEKWAQAAHLPSFEEYMEVAEVEITPYVVLAGCFMCLGKMATKEAYKWLKSRPRLVKSVCVRGRLMNDITGLKELLTTTGVSCLVLKTIMGLAQSISVFYNGYEGFTFPEGKIKEYMNSMFVNQSSL
ncbi:unnamed protein product [Eruca vesicaria subsp. sativa]|uniref:Terpene synthase metal-binding domain-containing protein n=1 Tax=Eruca vesicaria subsp. sativa TaxID=29727 RepID=A0ABC8LL13_ERUVS|nr:unnamed protein product [Eruca vesicaria subsp. sativa]